MFLPPRFWRGTPLCVLVAFLVAGYMAGSGSAAPVITEFMAVNSGEALVDEDGDSSDWIEIFNPDPVPVELGGFGLSDDSDRPLRWILPAVTVESGQRLIVFASSKDRAIAGAELHTNFSLNGSGEYLGLSDPAGQVVSEFSPEFPRQLRDTSFGIGSGGNTGYLMVPTPGSANGVAREELTAAPTFSVKHGYYTKPVVVELRSATPGSTVLYTTDGSVPTRLNGQRYREPIVVGSTTVFRAVAVAADAVPSEVVTSSYLFPADIKNQPEMSQLIVGAEAFASEIEADLAALPAISLALSDEQFFGSDGIYTNFQRRGREAEVPVSIEYFDPEGEGGGGDGFQIDAGIRIHGGQARFHEKKPMRLFFRSDYGEGRLEYPLFPGSPVQEFDRLVLRSCGHDSWAIDWGFGRNDLTETATYMRDEFLRRTEQKMGLLSPHGKFVHVFINGEYWGMYDLHERADSAFFASHEGGDEDDWDVIEGGGQVVEGDSEAWNELLGLGTVGVTTTSQYSQVEGLLDMDSFIDSLITRMWSGDNDWLGPVFFGTFNSGPNNRNWFAGRRSRSGVDEKFHFFAWDAEISLGNDRFTNSGNHLLITDLTRINSPQSAGVVYDGLRDFEEFQIKFSDRIYEHFFNDGELTSDKTVELWDQLSDRIRGPVVAESARWGNIHGGEPLRRDVEWEDERLFVRETFLQQRPDIVLDQFKARGLYPDVEPPEFPSVAGGRYEDPVNVVLAVPEGQGDGQIFYSLDGTDPRRAASVDVDVLLPEFSPARILVPSETNGGSALGDAWKEFDDPVGIGTWREGPAAIGYETGTQGFDYRPLFRVDVQDEMFQVNGSIYMRIEFVLPDQAAVDAIARLVLKMRYDDGFAAFLNGTRVADSNAMADLAWNSLATDINSDQLAVLFEEFDLSAHLDQLRVGRNVLAIQGLNGTLDSSDLLISPELVASGEEVAAGISASAVEYDGEFEMAGSGSVKTRFLSDDGEWSALREEVFSIGNRAATAGDLVISELNYHPRDAEGDAELAITMSRSDFEFVEVTNISGEIVEMGGVRFADGVEFVFPAGALPAGERVLVVRDLEAFGARHPAVPAAQIAGIFGGDTGLSNGGERIVLEDAVGRTILDFVYDDRAPWPAAPDGDGQTLVLIAPGENPDHNSASNWRASRLVDGSPGGDEDAIDVDLDGLPDDWERMWFGDLLQDGGDDSDGDGLDHAAEFAAGTDPSSPDTDADGLNDADELLAGTDPNVRDTDGDGLADGVEVLAFRGNPLVRDTDGDGLDDGFEALVGLGDLDNRDSDGDGSGDFSEAQRGSDPRDGSSVPSVRETDYIIYASMDSPENLGAPLRVEGLMPVDGVVGGGLRFEPADNVDYGDIGDPGAASLAAIIWFKLDSLGRRNLITKGDRWGIITNGGSVSVEVAGVDPIEVASGIDAGVWHQVAIVIDGELDVVRGFFDGEEVGSRQLGDEAVLDSPVGLRLARGGDANVCLDEFSLLNFAISAAELRALFQAAVAGRRAIDVVGSDDSDFDLLSDDWERIHFGDLSNDGEGDEDGDGLANLDEFLLGTDPNEADSDGDGVGDQREVLAGTDPTDAASIPGARILVDQLQLHSSFDVTTVNRDRLWGAGVRPDHPGGKWRR